MNGNIPLVRVLGIPIRVNVSWFLTVALLTAMLALRVYPDIFPRGSRYRDDELVHWVMALASGLMFFASILLHELAHSIIARKQGIPVKGITLFIFGGVAQITAEAKRPLHEFVMALIGPLTSAALGAVFFSLWWLTGHDEATPVTLVLEWLFLMNIVLGVFNLAPGFPMDGGRVLRSILWGISGDFFGSTRLATLLGRGLGYVLMAVGALAAFRVLGFLDQWSGLWFIILGIFLESSARQSWVQAVALNTLGKFSAEDVMSRDLETVDRRLPLRAVHDRSGRRHRFILFVSDEDDQVVGVVTEKELDAVPVERRASATAEEAMSRAASAAVASPKDDAAELLHRMEALDVWHLPIVSESRVIGVVSKDALMRIIANRLVPRPRLAGSA